MSRRTLYVAAAFLLAAVGWLTYRHLRETAVSRSAARPSTVAASRADYVGSAACRTCHSSEFDAWSNSHHGLAMQLPTAGTVQGNFESPAFMANGVTTRFRARNGKYFVTAQDPDGKPREYEVHSVIGVDPVQQYVIALPGGKLQCLTVAWDTRKHRWYSLYPGQRIALDDPLHWTGRYQGWNLMCADCHTTDFRKGYDVRSDTYRSTWAEFDVGCEACHGPGKAHVAWARARGARAADSYGSRQTGAKLATARPDEDSRAEVEACAPCHSRRYRVGVARAPDDPFLDEFMPEVARDPLYFADGQIHDEVYEYGSFRQSKMYQRGVRCSDCHDPHSAKLRADGNALCTRCHQLHPNPRFPTLTAKDYDAPSHHHHAPGSTGAQCVSCHMPQRTFMVVDARRDHFIRPPRPDESVTYHTPNACTGCHTDRAASWAANAVQSWFGNVPRDSSYTRAIVAGRSGDSQAGALLSQIANDENRSAFARGTALDLLSGFPDSAPSTSASAARDGDPLVRAAYASAIQEIPFDRRVALAAPLLEDSVRAVRVAAARSLGTVPRNLLSFEQGKRLETVLQEYEQGLESMADMPSTHLNLAILEEERGRADLAEQRYRRALQMDPYFMPARSNLARLYDRNHRTTDAERELREGVRLLPREGELQYSLGLVLAENQEYDEAARTLARAAHLLPAQGRVRYNLALVLFKLGRGTEGDRVLAEAARIDPTDPEILYGQAFRYAEHGDWEHALPPAKKLVAMAPGDEDARRLLQRIEARGAAGRLGAPRWP